jgi:glycosyltransferase involved in cell wall biosynthesis
MRILIATTQVPFVQGGAEVLADDLCAALRGAGHEADVVRIPFQWTPAERIAEHMLACRLLDLTVSLERPVDRVIALKFPAYLVLHPNKVLWLIHQHRQAYDWWDDRLGYLRRQAQGPAVREAIRQADNRLPHECRAIYTISANVSRRLERFNHVASTPLYPPPRHAGDFFCATAEDYLFFPSRLSHAKRQDLVLRALAQARQPVRVHFAGRPDDPAYVGELHALAQRLKVARRVAWLGRLDEDEKRHCYARARGVVYPPLDEDLGYVTLEAMLASKPVVTCTDSGGPLEFIRHEQDGLVAEPEPAALAAALDRLWSDPAGAVAWGRSARRRCEEMEIGWGPVVRKLVA